ncbi:MAG: class I SAM-dependent methyltransferase [Epulopiscium sp.]|nr:class I SAM-dependent methyltransferase [Candidatus Epulonipiscium sp.]
MELENIKNYWNNRAEGYSLSINEQLQNDEKEEYLSMLQKYASNKTSLDCLDIGCGPGFLSILLAQWGHKVTAVDYSENMLEYASKNFFEAKVDVSLLQMDAQNLRFEDASFDYNCVARSGMESRES